MNRPLGGLVTLVILGLTFALPGMAAVPQPAQLTRYFGATRIDTAIDVSRNIYSDGAQTVVVATARDFPDALTGAPLAYALGGPLLLTGPTPTEELLDEIARLRPSEVVVLGGTAAISDATFEQLVAAPDGATGRRIAGSDRYDTAARIAETLWSMSGDGARSSEGAFVVSGQTFADAVAVAPLAARKAHPILLVTRESVPTATRDLLHELGPDVTIVGGTAVVSERVAVEIDATHRIAGGDRFATSAAAWNVYTSEYGVPPVAWLATGTAFPDALAAGAPVAATSGGLLLTATDTLPGPTAAALASAGGCEGKTRGLAVVGGAVAVSEAVAREAFEIVDCASGPEPEPTPTPPSPEPSPPPSPRYVASELVSVSTDGTLGNGAVTDAVASAYLGTVAFITVSTNLDPRDTDADSSLYIRDRQAGTTQFIRDGSGALDMTPDGRFVLHCLSTGGACALIDLDEGTTEDVPRSAAVSDDGDVLAAFYRVHRRTETGWETTFVTDGIEAEGPFALSGDGTTMMYGTNEDGVAGVTDGNGTADVFLYGVESGVHTLLSRAGDRTGNGRSVAVADAISRDGETAFILSEADDLNRTGDVTGSDVYIHRTGHPLAEIDWPHRIHGYPFSGDTILNVHPDGHTVVAGRRTVLSVVDVPTGSETLVYTEAGTLVRAGSSVQEWTAAAQLSEDRSGLMFLNGNGELTSSDTNGRADVVIAELIP